MTSTSTSTGIELRLDLIPVLDPVGARRLAHLLFAPIVAASTGLAS